MRVIVNNSVADKDPNYVPFGSIAPGMVFYKDLTAAELAEGRPLFDSSSAYFKVGDRNCKGTNTVTVKTGHKSRTEDNERVYIVKADLHISKYPIK